MADSLRRARPPERLASGAPLAIPAALPKSPVRPPFTTVLAEERRAYLQGFETFRQNQRHALIKRIQNLRDSRVIVYYSVGMLTPKHAELIQDVLSMRDPAQRLDLFLLSPGGYSDAAYKMVMLCRNYTTDEFAILVPYYAKSAATLLCLGADELVMGPASELGPIDPRIAVPDQYGRVVNVSAVSIRDALDMIESRVKGSPEKALLYTSLLEKIDLNLIGEYERALKSAEQYAEVLLKRYMLKSNSTKATEVAANLARQYYSHGYAIDRNEARTALGLNVTNAPDELWDAMWQLHKLYDVLIQETTDGGRPARAVFESLDFKYIEYAAAISRSPSASIDTSSIQDAKVGPPDGA